ncbi:MAG: glycosyltransferase family 2 protein, partial [Candidatus Syntrophonatronum acetioxidans]
RKFAGGGFGLVKKFSLILIKIITGRVINSPLSGQRALKKEILLKGVKKARGFGLEFGLTLQALLDGWKVKEVPASMSHRPYGKNLAGFLHRGRQLRDILKTFILMVLFPKKQVS